MDLLSILCMSCLSHFVKEFAEKALKNKLDS